MNAKLPETKPIEEIEVRHSQLPRPGYDQLFKKHGVLDRKLFHANNKITFTFVANSEVVSLHFDSVRKTIFYKGHNVANLKLTPIQKEQLLQFKKELEKNPETESFAGPYSEVFEKFVK